MIFSHDNYNLDVMKDAQVALSKIQECKEKKKDPITIIQEGIAKATAGSEFLNPMML